MARRQLLVVLGSALALAGVVQMAGGGVAGAAGAAQTAPAHPTAVAAQREALDALRSGQVGGPIRGLRVPKNGPVLENTNAVTSTNWSGYADDGSLGNTYKSVSGTWVQPTTTPACASETGVTLTAFWVGLDGYTSSTVEQDGTMNECYDGIGYNYDWYEMYPAGSISVSPINAGDTITASVSKSGKSYVLSVEDSTTPSRSFSTTKTCSHSTCVDSSAEWIAEAPCCVGTAVFPLTPFPTWTPKSSVVSGGVSGTISSYPNDAIALVNSADTYDLAEPGALNTKGNRFTDTYLASS